MTAWAHGKDAVHLRTWQPAVLAEDYDTHPYLSAVSRALQQTQLRAVECNEEQAIAELTGKPPLYVQCSKRL